MSDLADLLEEAADACPGWQPAIRALLTAEAGRLRAGLPTDDTRLTQLEAVAREQIKALEAFMAGGHVLLEYDEYADDDAVEDYGAVWTASMRATVETIREVWGPLDEHEGSDAYHDVGLELAIADLLEAQADVHDSLVLGEAMGDRDLTPLDRQAAALAVAWQRAFHADDPQPPPS